MRSSWRRRYKRERYARSRQRRSARHGRSNVTEETAPDKQRYKKRERQGEGGRYRWKRRG